MMSDDVVYSMMLLPDIVQFFDKDPAYLLIRLKIACKTILIKQHDKDQPRSQGLFQAGWIKTKEKPRSCLIR